MTFKILPKWRNFAKSAHTCCLLPTFCISVFLFFRLFRLFPRVLYLSLIQCDQIWWYFETLAEVCKCWQFLKVYLVFGQHLEPFLGKKIMLLGKSSLMLFTKNIGNKQLSHLLTLLSLNHLLPVFANPTHIRFDRMSLHQCDQIWWNFATLAKVYESLAIFWQFISFLVKYWACFSKFVTLLGQLSLL